MTTFDPSPPPSAWRLDGVPRPIIDSIAEQLRLLDEVDQTIPNTAHRQPAPHSAMKNPGRKSFGQYCKNMSLVCKSFRQSVIAEGIFNFIEITDVEDVKWTSEQLGSTIRPLVTRFSIRGDPQSQPFSSQVVDTLKTFISTLKNLQYIWDHVSIFALHTIPLPPTLTFVQIFFGSADWTPKALTTLNVQELQLAPTLECLQESESAREAKYWHKKVSGVMKGLHNVDKLSLGLPGLRFVRGGDFPADVGLEDPLGGTECAVGSIEITLPFCWPGASPSRHYHWEGYLGWLLNTQPRFKSISCKLRWTPELIRGPAITHHDLLVSFALEDLEFDPRMLWDQRYRLRGTLQSTRDEAMTCFIASIMSRHRMLESLDIDAFAAIGKDVVPTRAIRVSRHGQKIVTSRKILPATVQVTSMISRIFEGHFLASGIPHFPDHVRPIDVVNALTGVHNPFESIHAMAAAAGFVAPATLST